MSDREASRTALATAYLRAAHQLLDSPPLILEDPLALTLLGGGAAQRISASIERYRTPEAAALRSHVVLRSRFAEDRLAAAVQRGVTQYVILGAGFDTFALRQPAWANSLRILEVDHPATQDLKQSMLAEAGLVMPANAALAQVDFERESLQEGLLRHGVSLRQPAFFSWLGVTMYLKQTAIEAALRSMAAFPAGSEVVLTFMQPDTRVSAAAMQSRNRLAQLVADAGEPFVSQFEPQAMLAMLAHAGFTDTGLLQPQQAQVRYYLPGRADLPPPRQAGIAYAVR